MCVYVCVCVGGGGGRATFATFFLLFMKFRVNVPISEILSKFCDKFISII